MTQNAFPVRWTMEDLETLSKTYAAEPEISFLFIPDILVSKLYPQCGSTADSVVGDLGFCLVFSK